MFKVNNKDIRTTRRSGVFIVNFEHISHIALVFSIFGFEQVNVSWEEERITLAYIQILSKK